MLRGLDHGRSRVAGPTQGFRALITLLVRRWYWLEENGKLVNLRPGGATREKGSIIEWEDRGEHQRIF
jgi:hypothetical protein